MKKYEKIQDVVGRLTDNKTFRTFFTVYLLAETEDERQLLNTRFWRDAAELSPAESQLLRAEFTRCFLRLPALSADLLEKAGVPAV